MKRFAIVALCASGLALGCKGSSSTTAPSNGSNPSSTSGTTVFSTQLAASNEVPPVANAEANAGGTATITLHTTKDAAGNITAATADFQIATSGFPAGSTITAAHIHPGGAGTNNGILVNTSLASGELAANGAIAKNGINVPSDQAKAIIDNPAAYYFNVHSSLNPNGVARSQLGSGNAGSGGGTPNPDPGTGY